MREAGWRDERFANSLCDYLATVSNEAGLVPPLLIDALSSPHAPHWANLPEAGLNPTAGLCGLLHFQGATHPWLARATEACVRVLIESPPSEAHALHCAARLTEGLADQAAANRILDIIAAALPKAAFFKSDAGCTSYGLTPLHFAPTPESRLAKLFSTQQRLAHLTELKGRQQEDGGWPVSWETTGPAATAEWAALVTLEAVRTLSAYNQLD